MNSLLRVQKTGGVFLISLLLLLFSASLVYGEWNWVNPPFVRLDWFLRTVHFTSADEGWAVGESFKDLGHSEGVLLRYSNGTWTSVTPPFVSSSPWNL